MTAIPASGHDPRSLRTSANDKKVGACRRREVFAKYDASTHKWPRGFPYGSFPMIYLVPADREAKPVRCNPNEDTDGKFIPAEHIVQFVDKAAYTLRGSFSRHHRETIELDSIDED